MHSVNLSLTKRGDFRNLFHDDHGLQTASDSTTSHRRIYTQGPHTRMHGAGPGRLRAYRLRAYRRPHHDTKNCAVARTQAENHTWHGVVALRSQHNITDTLRKPLSAVTTETRELSCPPLPSLFHWSIPSFGVIDERCIRPVGAKGETLHSGDVFLEVGVFLGHECMEDAVLSEQHALLQRGEHVGVDRRHAVAHHVLLLAEYVSECLEVVPDDFFLLLLVEPAVAQAVK
mmetsp:Transcript_51871/g.130322  ORF Transcript_51871/g.130322 Transcript_51871/m.130322 type:complete len:230 (-) Transcript_51871:689-1378(-)